MHCESVPKHLVATEIHAVMVYASTAALKQVFSIWDHAIVSTILTYADVRSISCSSNNSSSSNSAATAAATAQQQQQLKLKPNVLLDWANIEHVAG